jgi:hypothetical protein
VAVSGNALFFTEGHRENSVLNPPLTDGALEGAGRWGLNKRQKKSRALTRGGGERETSILKERVQILRGEALEDVLGRSRGNRQGP